MPRDRTDKQSGKSSGKSSKYAASDSAKYPTDWSKWERDDENRRYVSYRLLAPENAEYDYQYDDKLASQDQDSSSYQPKYGTSLPSPASQSLYFSAPQTQAFSSHSASQSQTGSSLHPISESPPLSYTHKPSIDDITSTMQDMNLQDEKDKDPPKIAPVIKTRNRKETSEKGPFGDIRYRVYHERDFEAGKVIMLNWVEPSGNLKGGGSNRSEHTAITKDYKEGTDQFQKIRRFLIIKTFKGHCLGMPINTYSGQGVNKHGVHPDNHAVIYSSDNGPIYMPGEASKLTRNPPIMMIPTRPENKLHEASRLNYAKVYTIEYNVKVKFIGKIHPDSGHHVVSAYNEIHKAVQPFPGATYPSQSLGESSRQQQSYAGTTYNSSYNTPYASSAPSQSHAPNTSPFPYPPYNQNSTNSGASGYGQNPGYGSFLAQSSVGIPRTPQQPSTAPYTYPLSPNNTQPSAYSTPQAQSLTSSSYPGGSAYRQGEFSSTPYPQSREYGQPDDNFRDG